MLKSEYITTADQVFADLEQMQDPFYLDAQVINALKCSLIRGEKLQDMAVSGVPVQIFHSADGYDVCYQDRVLSLTVVERQIVDFVLRKR